MGPGGSQRSPPPRPYRTEGQQRSRRAAARPPTPQRHPGPKEELGRAHLARQTRCRDAAHSHNGNRVRVDSGFSLSQSTGMTNNRKTSHMDDTTCRRPSPTSRYLQGAGPLCNSFSAAAVGACAQASERAVGPSLARGALQRSHSTSWPERWENGQATI